MSPRCYQVHQNKCTRIGGDTSLYIYKHSWYLFLCIWNFRIQKRTIVKTVNLVPFSSFSIVVHFDSILVTTHHDAIDLESRDLNLLMAQIFSGIFRDQLGTVHGHSFISFIQGEGGGSKSLKMCLHNIWMVSYTGERRGWVNFKNVAKQLHRNFWSLQDFVYIRTI